MSNHPNRGTNTYWVRFPRNFSNDYVIGVATTPEHAEQYDAEGYERIDRSAALRRLSKRPESHEQLYASAERDGEGCDRFELARALRTSV